MALKLYSMTDCAPLDLLSNTRLSLNHLDLHLYFYIFAHAFPLVSNVSNCSTSTFYTATVCPSSPQLLDSWVAFILPLCHKCTSDNSHHSASYAIFQTYTALDVHLSPFLSYAPWDKAVVLIRFSVLGSETIFDKCLLTDLTSRCYYGHPVLPHCTQN